jgi:hypothetical protein
MKQSAFAGVMAGRALQSGPQGWLIMNGSRIRGRGKWRLGRTKKPSQNYIERLNSPH